MNGNTIFTARMKIFHTIQKSRSEALNLYSGTKQKYSKLSLYKQINQTSWLWIQKLVYEEEIEIN